MFNFTTNEKRVLSVWWQHEQKMDPEEFTKEELVEARL
jgi:hypothetical protein